MIIISITIIVTQNERQNSNNDFLYPDIISNMQRFIPAALLVNLDSNTVSTSLTAGRDYCQMSNENLPFKISIFYKNFISFLLCAYCWIVLVPEKIFGTNYST